jgi:signal transduction histidine kinase
MLERSASWGWIGSLVGFHGGAPIEPWAPMMLFVIALGRAMDCDVFLLSTTRDPRHGRRQPHTSHRGVSMTNMTVGSGVPGAGSSRHAEGIGRAARDAFAPLFRSRTWAETLHCLLDLPIGITTFTIVITMLSLSAGLMITLVGLPLLVATLMFGRAIGVFERARVRLLLGDELPVVAPLVPLEAHGTFWQKTCRRLSDVPAWKALAYGALLLPWGIVTFTTVVVLWSVALGFATFPLYGWALPSGDGLSFGDDYALTGWGRGGSMVGIGIVGVLLLIVTPRIVHALTRLSCALVRALLSPGREAQLRQRVEHLQESRTASVEGSATELRRIERDLHDGAQQRLVGLAMDLGLARERLAVGGDSERASELVARAHDEAKLAISELRDLVRGIHPAVLTDRGLDAALSAIAARCPIPVDMRVILAARPPAAVEAAAYFVVSEALTNVAKHSGARRASVDVGSHDGMVTVEVRDDGVGGAVVRDGGGLTGLRDRVIAAEGRFRIASPVGGPTVLIAELPC